MGKVIQKFGLKFLVLFTAVAGFSASAGAENPDNSVNETKTYSSSNVDVLVFGKFQLVKNGYDVKLSDGVFGNTAALTLYRVNDQVEMKSSVGDDGEISWYLTPGDYYISNISFKHRGETIMSNTSFMFTVTEDTPANYIGTITLEATVNDGYHGASGTFDRFTVRNDCETDCADRLAALGLTAADATTELPEWQTRVARAH